MFTKSSTCPGGQHSHDDYDGGKCHDANQVHRGGRTDRVGPAQAKVNPGLMHSPNPTNPISKPSADIKENEKKVGEILALGEVRKPIGKVKEEMAQCKESYQIETQKGMATFHISDDQRVYVHFQPHGNGKPMDFQVQADSRSLDILRGTDEKPDAPKMPGPKKDAKVDVPSNVEKPFTPGTLPESITFEGKKLTVPEKNREAVKRWLNDNHIIHAHFDEKSFTDEDAHTVGVAVAENMAILPQMGAACQFLGSRTDIREQLGAKRTRGEYAYFTMASDQAHGGIAVNENALKNREAMFKEMKESNQKKWSPEGCGTLKSLIDHECGHAIDYATRGSIEFDKLYDEWFNLPREQKINTLSEYALKDRREWFAECWSEYRNNPNPRKYAKAIGELVMNYAKRDKR